MQFGWARFKEMASVWEVGLIAWVCKVKGSDAREKEQTKKMEMEENDKGGRKWNRRRVRRRGWKLLIR